MAKVQVKILKAVSGNMAEFEHDARMPDGVARIHAQFPEPDPDWLTGDRANRFYRSIFTECVDTFIDPAHWADCVAICAQHAANLTEIRHVMSAQDITEWAAAITQFFDWFKISAAARVRLWREFGLTETGEILTAAQV